MVRGTFVGRLGGFVAVASAMTAVVACSSLPDLHFADSEGGIVGEGGFEGGNVDGGEGGMPPACTGGTAEICNDGVDNDCNLLVDCKDSACIGQGFACEPVPTGWTAVSFSATARPSCAAGETAVDLMVAAGDSTATCMCSCNAVGGSCGSGNYTVSSSGEATCLVAPTTTTASASSAACAALGSSIALSTNAMVTLPAGPTACSVVTGVNGALTNGRLCQPTGVGGGCATGEVCAPKPSSTLSSCVTTNGKSACPAAFPNRSTAGTDATDSRTCSGCACGSPTACTGGTLSLYDNVMCKTNGMFKGAEGITSTCSALAPSSGFTATHFKSTPPSGGCGSPTNQGTVTGGVTFVNERTVCCK